MFENVDVQITQVIKPFSSRRTAPWKYTYSGNVLYKGRVPRYTILYVWEGAYYNHSPEGDCVLVPSGSLVIFRYGYRPHYNTEAVLPSLISNLSFYTKEPIPMDLPDNICMIFKPESSWEVEKHMRRALQLGEEMPFGWKMELRSIASHLLICMMKQYFEGRKRTYVPALLAESINLIRRDIFKAPMSVSDAAQLCHVTPTYLIRIFGRYMGMTPKRFMDNLRVERACELLLCSNKSIEEIAMESGFSEARQMRRVFHEHMGVSPKEYRGQI